MASARTSNAQASPGLLPYPEIDYNPGTCKSPEISPSRDTMLDPRFCIAPMMDWTDRHERYFLRLLSRRALLYTEMVNSGALIHGDAPRFLYFNEAEHPVAIQLGGSEPDEMARCAVMAQEAGFDEVNLNIGCPSDRVQSGRFGACLMAEPERVARCVSAMQREVDIPVTVKTRIGIDDHDSEAFLERFVTTVAEAGCRRFILHARIAVLQGLSPRENRNVPPLNYPRVFALKQRHPQLSIIINGGIQDIGQARGMLENVDGVMVGREAYQNPWFLADVDRLIYGDAHAPASRQQVLRELLPYVRRELAEGTPLQHMTRHVLGLFRNRPGGKRFRQHLSENAHRKGAGISVLEDALARVSTAET